MTQRVRVNIRSVANTAAVRFEKRNGREVAIVPSATLPDDVVMNDIRYPADEIEKSYKTLNRTPAPLGHPMVNGQFLSAYDPEAQNMNGIGAWNENARRDGGRVLLDKVIDVERANACEGGKRVMDAINKGEPIHTSTGLLCLLENAEGEGYKSIAREIEFDHDAILLDEEGAATPAQGVGMMVNADGKQTEIQVINSRVEWAEDDLAWAAEHLLDSAERLDKAKEREALLPRLVEALRGIMSGPAETPENVQKEKPMDNDTKEAIDAVNAKVDAIPDAIANAVAEAMKPLVEAQNAATEAQEAKDKATHEALVNQVVNADISGFTKDVAEKMDATALQALLHMNSAKPKAAPLMPGFLSNSGNDGNLSPLAWGTNQ